MDVSLSHLDEGPHGSWSHGRRSVGHDGQINGRDNHSNGDLHDDDEQVYVVFRTNATGGAYGAAGVWVALPPTMTNVTAAAPNLSAGAALYLTAGEVESSKGEPFQVVYKGVPYAVASPENYEVRFFENGSNDEVYIALPNGHFAKLTKSSSAPSICRTLEPPPNDRRRVAPPISS